MHYELAISCFPFLFCSGSSSSVPETEDRRSSTDDQLSLKLFQFSLFCITPPPIQDPPTLHPPPRFPNPPPTQEAIGVFVTFCRHQDRIGIGTACENTSCRKLSINPSGHNATQRHSIQIEVPIQLEDPDFRKHLSYIYTLPLHWARMIMSITGYIDPINKQ